MKILQNLVLCGHLLLSSGLLSFVANQVCDDGGYDVINEPRRSTQSVYNDAFGNPLCDSGIDEGTWFRFSSYAGDALVERDANDSVPMQQCGTLGPIYISGLGSHPVTDNTSTTATVCANYAGNPCNWNAVIQIYKCPGYFLYKLKAPPGCAISYCAGEGNLCNLGDMWNGQSCVSNFPAMKGLPLFSWPNFSGIGVSNEIYFRCEVQYDRQPNDFNARFRVTFLFDGQPLEYVGGIPSAVRLEPTILTPDGLVAVLDELHLRGRIGREISCQAESYWDGYNDAQSNLTSAESYYAAFESAVESYIINLTNGSTFNVAFKSTLPLTCRHCISNNFSSKCCKYTFRMSDYNASSVECFLSWTGGDTAAVTVYFVPGSTQLGKSFALVFKPYNDDQVWGLSMWRNYMIPPVSMVVVPQSSPYKICTSISDPHLGTFDGVPFNNLMVGDFYLAKAINDFQHMEIQVRQEICFGVSCNCGVVVREGNSAFRISVCDTGSWSPTQRSPTVVRLLTQDPADSSTVYTDGTGLKFSIRMPSGLRVEVTTVVQWFNVEVHLPPEYHGKTDSASMCGNSNGNRNDDSTTNLDRFRISNSASYFSQKPNCSSKFNVATTRCGCNTTYPTPYVCSNSDPYLNDVSIPNEPYPGHWTSRTVCRQTPVAAMASSLYDSSNSENDFILDDDILFPPYTYDPSHGVNVSFTWPTPKGKTEQEVEQYCMTMLQSSPVYADCNAHADLSTIIAMCKSDIQIMDDYISVNAYASTFEQDCLNKIVASINSSSDSGSSNPTLEVLTSVSGKICPNRCSGHGTCSEGNCTCTAGYIGADCSIDQSKPPSLTGIIRGGACDVRTRPCDVIGVFGSGAALSSALKCRFTDQSTEVTETYGTFITAVEYSCPVPETTTHRRRRSVTEKTSALSTRKVSITADGALYSNALDLVLFDSVCMECNSTGTCRQKGDSCLISEGCFPDKAINPDDSCLQCVPSVSRNSWKDITVVESWKPCTRGCDVGIATRSTVCSNKIVKKEVEFCEVESCPDDAEQKTHGFGITLSSEDLKLIIEDPVGSLVPFSDALNQYCSKNSAVCCNSVGIPTHISGVTYTSPELLTYASGYPVVDNTDTSLKIIAKIDLAKLGAECSQTQNQGSNIVYADAKLIYDAVNSEKSKIEQALSITITSVWSANSLPSSALRSSTSVSILYNLIGFWMLIILVQSNLA